MGIPDELIEAARIDGASECADLLADDHAAVRARRSPRSAILTFLGSWNNFLWPLVVAQSEDKYTLPVALALYSVGQNAHQVRPPAGRLGGDHPPG